jgi:hypothetical protein
MLPWRKGEHELLLCRRKEENMEKLIFKAYQRMVEMEEDGNQGIRVINFKPETQSQDIP